jgi:hypothetical protein
MILNNKILKAIESVELTENERMKSTELNMLYDSVESEPLTLLSFTILADMFNVDYKFTFKSQIYTIEYTNNDIDLVWSELDKLYYQLTCKRIHSASMSFMDIKEVFNKIYTDILFE